MSANERGPGINPIGEAWLAATDALGIEAVAPFILSSNRERYLYSALVRDSQAT
jgi:hypothetical protein